MTRFLILTAAISGFLAVALGAFGAHGLEETLAANGREATFNTANLYHITHTLALLAVAWLAGVSRGRFAAWAGIFMLLGIVLFSGSLYLLAIFNLSFMGAVAPLGGGSLLAGWLCIGIAARTIGSG